MIHKLCKTRNTFIRLPCIDPVRLFRSASSDIDSEPWKEHESCLRLAALYYYPAISRAVCKSRLALPNCVENVLEMLIYSIVPSPLFRSFLPCYEAQSGFCIYLYRHYFQG
ncbi:MAG: hypothetical protein BECKG1743D_GA0114223_110301 [Candidatus Kentron sp. G]|nr:MAG: hypothetical protein BECKG1743D_GA0114223_109491 [Candidatus Kentron sp. G]VFN07299.1 MAG: hypothetical protein BECKG1743D_GA0114223_110301 [Candidatus Kentron sp. G]